MEPRRYKPRLDGRARGRSKILRYDCSKVDRFFLGERIRSVLEELREIRLLTAQYWADRHKYPPRKTDVEEDYLRHMQYFNRLIAVISEILCDDKKINHEIWPHAPPLRAEKSLYAE